MDSELVSRAQVLLQYLLASDAAIEDDRASERASEAQQLEHTNGDPQCSA